MPHLCANFEHWRFYLSDQFRIGSPRNVEVIAGWNSEAIRSLVVALLF